MARSGSSVNIARKSAWSRVRPSYRLWIGFGLIALIGLLGQTPKSFFWVQAIWPHAALWGAVGWASAGLSVRPMIMLCMLGVAQDISFDGPIGVFWLVNLATYGLAAQLGETFDVETDAVRALMVAAVSMAAGFIVLWFLASGTANHGVRVIPRIQEWGLTLVLFLPLAPIFRLGGRPGERIGAA